MSNLVEFYCRRCQSTTTMDVTYPVENLQLYWLHCHKCDSRWRVPIEVYKTCAKASCQDELGTRKV